MCVYEQSTEPSQSFCNVKATILSVSSNANAAAALLAMVDRTCVPVRSMHPSIAGSPAGIFRAPLVTLDL